MQVRTSDAPARVHHAGSPYYFCSDRCLERFQADPDRYAGGDAAGPMPVDGGSGRDPVCGMSVDLAAPGARAVVDGKDYVFCMQGCADAFVADPGRYLDPATAGS
ncbi:MAG: copA, partial [Frankiales bacterium]|nr:copA [Frankiales bacterium]